MSVQCSKTLDPLELESQNMVNNYVGAGNRSSTRAQALSAAEPALQAPAWQP